MSTPDQPKPFDLEAFKADLAAKTKAYAPVAYNPKSTEQQTEERRLLEELLDMCAAALLATDGNKGTMEVIEEDLIGYRHGSGINLFGSVGQTDFYHDLALRVAEKASVKEVEEDATSRDALEEVLSAPTEEQQARIDAAMAVMSKEVENDKHFVTIPGKIKVDLLGERKIVIQFIMQHLNAINSQGGVIVDRVTGEVEYYPEHTMCNYYLQRQGGGNPVALADDFIRQLKASE